MPLTALVAVVAFFAVRPDDDTPAAAPSPSPSASPAPRSTAPVQMAAPALSERAAVVCRALLSQLPNAVRDLRQRPVTAGSEQNAAYGDPAITVACGVPPTSYPPTDWVYPLNRVCWHSAQRAGATVWTTVDREVPVQVTVPGSYDQPGQWTLAFSDPVVASVPSIKDVPTGCTD
ncbi:DUF3515 family protein [Phytohabitans rumicis]|uniref:DUF3515 domain-containing protein n=1 Tax=Phytohabitans rumicis TaxID=1076125 RepID=A0A6V8KVK7_9ACTN|nr:DUF3515 family protein [Phytohabitans rumicis]GFJ89113.1 hypothetical protein Prum_027550 [Phytohabitans rumicis]